MCVQIHIAAVLYLEMIQGEQIDWFGGFFFSKCLGQSFHHRWRWGKSYLQIVHCL